MIKIFSLFLLLLIACASFGLSEQDSLLNEWDNVKNNDTIRLASLHDLAWFYAYSTPDSSIVFSTKMIAFAKEKTLWLWEAKAWSALGVAYYVKGNNVKSLDCFFESLNIKESNHVDLGDLANSYQNIGVIYKSQGLYEMALEYYNKGLKIELDLGKVKDAAMSYLNIGNLYNQIEELDTALHYYNRTLKQADLLNSQVLATINANMGTIYKSKKMFAPADSLFKIALLRFEEGENQRGMASTRNNFGFLYIIFHKHKKAITECREGLRISEEREIHQTAKSACDCLYQAYKAVGNDKLALVFHEKFIFLRDSILSEEHKAASVRQELKYVFNKEMLKDSLERDKRDEIKELNHQAELKIERTQRYGLYVGIALLIIMGLILFRSYSLKKRDNFIIREQKLKVEERNMEITDSIRYAKRLQTAILPPRKLVKQYLKKSFILYKPKDIVAGDFYWMEHKNDKILFAAADCTGHGVPGALVSVFCNNGLNRSVREHGLTDPGKILDKTREIVIKEFEKSEDEVRDGMDIALCSLYGNTLEYAGANNPLWIIRAGAEVIEEIKADRQPIGNYEHARNYTTHKINLNEGDTIYIFSDGYADQFGGANGKKMKAANFKMLLLSLRDKTMEEQHVAIDLAFDNWRGDLEQIDDVCVIGVKI